MRTEDISYSTKWEETLPELYLLLIYPWWSFDLLL